MIDPKAVILTVYAIVGIFMTVFNKKVGSWNYKLTLLYTDKLNIGEFFLFKINNANRDSFFFLTRAISVSLGLTFMATAIWIYYSYFLK